MEEFLISILSSFAIFICFSVFYRIKQKEEKKYKEETEFVLKQTKGFSIFFIIWIILCFIVSVGIVILNIFDPMILSSLLTILGVIIFFMILGIIGLISVEFDYVIVKEDKIIARKGLKKIKIINYNEIKYYQSSNGGSGVIQCFNKDGIPILTISSFHVGVEKFSDLISRMNIETLPLNNSFAEFKDNENYINYKRYCSYKIKTITSLIISILLFGLFAMILPQLKYPEYLNYEVNGIVKEIRTTDETITIYLVDDDNKYYINNIIYDAIDERVIEKLKEGIFVKFLIANKDEYNRLQISQLEIDGHIYLDMNDAKNKEYSNYKLGIVTSFVFLGLGIILFLYFLINQIKFKIFLKNNNFDWL